MKNLYRVLLGVAVIALVLSGCSAQPGTVDGDPAPVTLTIGATLEPPTLDPSGSDAASIPQALLYNVYETLLKVDTEGNYQPLLAESWEVSTDRLTYTFALDPDAKFASGRQVTAADVEWSIERLQSGDNVAAKTQHKAIKSVEASDDATVVVTLSQPSNSWLFNMASTAGVVFDSQSTEDFATMPAGSGPFQLDRWTKGSDLILKRNDAYWGTQTDFNTVTFRYFTDPNAQNSAMLSGGLDVISSVQAPQAIDQFTADTARFTVIEGTTNGEVVMSLNNESTALKDKRVRQAINYAIDRKALLESVWNGKGTLIGSMVPPTDPWYEDLSQTYPYDPHLAKQLLKDAGYADGLKLRMRLPVVPYATGAGQFAASQLKDVGIDATIDELEFPRWLDEVFTKADYDISIVAHVEPRDIVKFGNPDYYWRYNNAEVAELLAQADAGTEAEQTTLMKQVSKIISDDAAADFLFLLPNLIVTTPQVQGIPQNATTLSFDLTTVKKVS